ncbi:MAG: DUF2283 domain-containing protein [bacterium]|nr:DUF2283 domain-containing protein [bacterium]
MDRIKVIHDIKGRTLTVWWGNPDQEYVSTLTDDEVIIMKDPSGRVIGFEALHYHPEETGPGLSVETSIQPAVAE